MSPKEVKFLGNLPVRLTAKLTGAEGVRLSEWLDRVNERMNMDREAIRQLPPEERDRLLSIQVDFSLIADALNMSAHATHFERTKGTHGY